MAVLEFFLFILFFIFLFFLHLEYICEIKFIDTTFCNVVSRDHVIGNRKASGMKIDLCGREINVIRGFFWLISLGKSEEEAGTQ